MCASGKLNCFRALLDLGFQWRNVGRGGICLRYLLYFVMTSQLIGAFLVFPFLSLRLQNNPLANLSAAETIFLAITILTYLLGVLGAILVLAGKRAGFALSIAHQLMLVPIIFIPNGFRWILEDVVSVGLFLSHNANGLGFVTIFALGDATILSVLKPQPDTTYVGINVVAVAFAIFVYAAMKRETLMDGIPDSVPLARLVIYGIAILQILAGVIALALIYQQYRATPSGAAVESLTIVHAGIYALGLIGAICLFLRWQLGIALSILFHLLSVPVIVLAARNIAYAVVQIVNVLVFYVIEGSERHFGLILHAGTDLLVQFPKYAQVTAIFAVNLFAVICVIYLYAARSHLRVEPTARVFPDI
jgi:hypothetical protein